MAAKLESDLQDTVNWHRKWLVDFNAVKSDQSNNTGVIDLKMNGSVFEEISSFKMLRLSFSSKLD